MAYPRNHEWSFTRMLSSIILRPIFSLLRWLGVRRPLALTFDSIKVFVKISEGSNLVTVPLDLPKDWNVGQVKGYLAEKLGKTASGFRIILAGKELHDNVKVSDCDLGPQTVIHAIRVVYDEKSDSVPTEPSPAPMNASLMDLQLTKEEQTIESEREVKRRAHFYVYCDSASCRSNVPQPGKLRVRCSVCREGAVVVLADPCSWEDVLQPQRIQGQCQNGLCPESCLSESDSSKLVDVEFYFKCHGPDHRYNDKEQASEAPPLHLIRPNIRQIPCLSCGDVLPDDDVVVVFDCVDQHVICLDCFKLYCLSRLNERQFTLDPNLGYTLGCPVGCNDSLISQLKHFKVLGNHDYERYQRFAAEESVLQSGGVLCPQPGCGMGLFSDDRRVVCSSCSFVFCRLCHQGFHIGECIQPGPDSITGNEDRGFEMDPLRVSRARWVDQLDPSSVLAIRLTTKPCPKCRTPTERDGGCMHMSCTKAGCGFQWCWVCQTEWSRDCMANHWFG